MPDKSWYSLIDCEWMYGDWNYKTDMEDIIVDIRDVEGMVTLL